MRIALSSLAATAALLLAGAAHAQAQDNAEFRLLAANAESAALVSTTVSGPLHERRLTNIMMASAPGPGGADNFVSEIVVNCPAGTIQYPRSIVYAGDEFLTEMPANDEWRVPSATSMDGAVVRYACKGELYRGETTKVLGLSAARAEGRAAMRK